MMVSIFFLLFLFGGGAALVALVGFAIVSKRLWIVPAAIGLAFCVLIAFGVLASVGYRFVPVSAQVASQVTAASHVVMQGPMTFNGYHTVNGAVAVSKPVWSKILLFAVLTTFLIGIVVRRSTSPQKCNGSRRAWPAVAVIFFIALMWGSVRINDHRALSVVEATGQPEEKLAAQQRTMVAVQRQATDQVRMDQHVVESDIRQEIEQFDAPRIQLPPAPGKAPNAPAAPATPAPSADVAKSSDKPAAAHVSLSKSAKDEGKKPVAASSSKRKKPDKNLPASIDPKLSKMVTKSKVAEETAANNEVAPTSDNPATTADGKPAKPSARPAWVDESPKRTGNTRREVIATDEYESIDECYQAADVYLLLKTYQRIQQLTGQPYTNGPLPSVTFQNGQVMADGQLVSYGSGNPYWADGRIRNLISTGVGTDYIRREIVAKDPKNNEAREYIETLQRSFGPMKKLYLQIEFTPAVDRELRRAWDAHERRERFAMVSVGSFSVLGLLALVFALLKIDTATKGYYTKRLFIGVPLAILGMFGLYAMLVEMGADLPH